MTRTDRRRFPVLFAAVALLALVGGLALPAMAQAQSAGVLVSNIGQSDNGGQEISNNEMAVGFTTGGTTGGYTLGSIEILTQRVSSFSIANLTVTLWDEDPVTNDRPGSSIATLTNPGSISANEVATFTAPTDTTLAAGTEYFVQLSHIGGANTLELERTTSSDEDNTSAAGWTIHDERLWRVRGSDVSWNTSNRILKIRVNAAGGEAPTLSTDATLTDLVVNDGSSDLTLTPTFVSGMYEYTAMVGNTVDEVTLTPTKNDDGATIVWLDGSDMTLTDADALVTGQQVTLAEGDNVIKVKVTAADGTATQTYTVTVNRAAAASACTLNTGDLWCGVVTVGTNSDGVGFVGELNALTDEVDAATGALTNNSGDQKITIGSDIYTVSGLTILASPPGTLALRITQSFPDSDAATLEFHIGTKTFKVSEATHFTSPYIVYTWADSGLSWSDDDMVDVLLRRAAATTTVTIAADQAAFTAALNDVTFTLTRTEDPAAALDVAVVLTQGGTLLTDEDLAQTVTFGAGEATAKLIIQDYNFLGHMVTEAEVTLTATVQTGSWWPTLPPKRGSRRPPTRSQRTPPATTPPSPSSCAPRPACRRPMVKSFSTSADRRSPASTTKVCRGRSSSDHPTSRRTEPNSPPARK